jgi:hypothetical protein
MISTAVYPYIWAAFVLGWPWAGIGSLPTWIVLIEVLIVCLVFVLVAKRASSKELSFWAGLSHISMRLRTGCANITLPLVLIVLSYVYVLSIVYVVLGFFHGKAWTEQKWIKTISGFRGFGDSQ